MDKIKVKISELLYYCFFGLLLFAKGIGLYDGQTAFKLILIAAAAAWIGKMCLTAYTRKEFIIIVLLLGTGIITYLVSGEKGAVLYILMITGLKNIPIKRVFTVGAWIWSISFIGTAILNATHLIDGPFKVHEKLGMDMLIRWGLGQSHPNVLHISYLVLVMFLVYLLGEKLTLKAVIGLMIGNILVFTFSVSSTGVITVTFYLGICLYCHYRKKPGRLEYLSAQMIFPIILLYSFAAPLVLKGELFERVNHFTNTRLNLARHFLTLRGPSLFGNRVADIITSQLTMDNSYVNAYVTYGLILTILIVGLYLVLIRKYCHDNRNGELAIILACLVAGIMEPFLFNTSFKNISLLFAAEILFTEKEGGKIRLPGRLDREVQLSFSGIGRLGEGFRTTLKVKGNKLLAAGLLFGLLGGIGYALLWNKPEAIIVPKKDIDVAILQQHPELEPIYIDNPGEVEKVIIYGYQSGETEMIVCDGEKFIAIELYRGMLTWGMLTGFAAFTCMLVYGKRKYAKTV